MPPAHSMHKASVGSDSTRRQSGRQARTSRSGPANYYARPYGSLGGGPVDEPQEVEPPGFFPAITYFADAVAALPKEVQRHVSLMKEVEAKVYGPTEALKSLTAKINKLPAPPPRHDGPSTQGLLSFTAANSTTASLSGSVINGVAPSNDLRVADVLDAANSQIDEQADLTRRSQFKELRQLIGTMIVNLDEKNNVMAEANRALAQQLSRMDSVMPHVENEISEEARLGSLTHWAYADNRVKKQTAPANERARRDVAATTNLAAAAAAVHDNDIAAARGQATRESKKTRHHHVDSDFDDKPTGKRAAPAKARKEVHETKAAGLGISNGAGGGIAPAKRRKVEKATAPAMERSASALKNARGLNTTPRSTPQAEPVKQRKKPGPAPGFVPVKKRQQAAAAAAAALNSGPNSANASPVLNTAQPDMSTIRPASSRVRQNSSTSNLQYSLLAGSDRAQNSRPSSAAGTRSVNGANGNGTGLHQAEHNRRAQETDDDNRMQVDQEPAKPVRANALKREDIPVSSALASPTEQPSRGRPSKVPTPLNAAEGGTGMLRTRSNRGNNSHAHGSTSENDSHQAVASLPPTSNAIQTSGSSTSTRASQSHSRTPELGSHRKHRGEGHHSHHRKTGSGAHILKQIASFNRSPDMDRHRSMPGEVASDISSGDELQNHVRHHNGTGNGSGSTSGSVSGGNGGKRSSSRRSAVPRGVSLVGGNAAASATSAPAAVNSGSASGRVSRASRQRATETETRSAQPSRSRNRTPEVEDDPGLEPDDDGADDVEEPVTADVDMEIDEPEDEEEEPTAQHVEEDDEEEEEEEDPNEPRYCYCGQGSFGEMIACDNEQCTMEWFHLQCTGLRNVPGDNVKWYCDVCKEAMGHTGRGGKKGRPGSRHAGH